MPAALGQSPSTWLTAVHSAAVAVATGNVSVSGGEQGSEPDGSAPRGARNLPGVGSGAFELVTALGKGEGKSLWKRQELAETLRRGAACCGD